MPILIKPGHEAYVQARAAGAKRLEAAVKAGYSPHESGAGRIERRPEVAARLAELRAGAPENAGPEATIAVLLAVAAASRALGTAAGLREARMATVEAHRVQVQLAEQRATEGAFVTAADLPPALTIEQWILRYGTEEDKLKVLAGEWRDNHDLHYDGMADDPEARSEV